MIEFGFEWYSEWRTRKGHQEASYRAGCIIAFVRRD